MKKPEPARIVQELRNGAVAGLTALVVVSGVGQFVNPVPGDRNFSSPVELRLRDEPASVALNVTSPRPPISSISTGIPPSATIATSRGYHLVNGWIDR